jgi:hypothetical protein
MTTYTQCIILSTKTVHALLLATADNSRLQVPLCPTQGKERQVPHISPAISAAPEAFLPLSASRVQGSWRCTLRPSSKLAAMEPRKSNYLVALVLASFLLSVAVAG